jgi:threonine dehydratase
VGDPLCLEGIRGLRERIAAHVLCTPVLEHEPRPGLRLLCKAESLQPTGAFKLRGAFAKLLSLPAGVPGVVAHSSGNHAWAVARAARVLGIPAVIVIPEDAPPLKVERTAAEGAEVVRCPADSEERVRRASALAAERGLVPVPPYDDPFVAAGQGTAALELVEAVGELDRFYAPISGGGLMAGCAVAVHGLSPRTEIVGAEPADADRARRSLAAGTRLTVPPPRTLADGLRVRTLGEVPWSVLRRHLARCETVTDAEMEEAMAFALYALRVVLEPSGAAALALALREGDGRCGVLLSGGNVESGLLARVAARGLAGGSASGAPR